MKIGAIYKREKNNVKKYETLKQRKSSWNVRQNK